MSTGHPQDHVKLAVGHRAKLKFCSSFSPWRLPVPVPVAVMAVIALPRARGTRQDARRRGRHVASCGHPHRGQQARSRRSRRAGLVAPRARTAAARRGSRCVTTARGGPRAPPLTPPPPSPLYCYYFLAAAGGGGALSTPATFLGELPAIVRGEIGDILFSQETWCRWSRCRHGKAKQAGRRARDESRRCGELSLIRYLPEEEQQAKGKLRGVTYHLAVLSGTPPPIRESSPAVFTRMVAARTTVPSLTSALPSAFPAPAPAAHRRTRHPGVPAPARPRLRARLTSCGTWCGGTRRRRRGFAGVRSSPG
jgi:hypothetical protein